MSIIYTKESLIQELQNIRSLGWITSRRRRSNAGAVGNTLEDLVGIQENNLPLPNAAEWELKVQRNDTKSLITLFHSEPSPRALKIVPWLVQNYGWPHEQAGRRYPSSEKSFRQTINAIQTTSRGFTITLDDINRKIIVTFNYNQINSVNNNWKHSLLQNGNDIFDNNYIPYWGYQDICNKAGTKLTNCFFIIADRKIEQNIEYFHYRNIKILENFSSEKFINAIRLGYVYIDFDARTRHNHRTKFRIVKEQIPFLYEIVHEI